MNLSNKILSLGFKTITTAEQYDKALVHFDFLFNLFDKEQSSNKDKVERALIELAINIEIYEDIHFPI